MIPHRFVTEYAARCRDLLNLLEGPARQADLLGSFGLLVASAAFTIPYRRITEPDHPLGRHEPGLSQAVRRLRKVTFLEAPFWRGRHPAFFRYAKIVNDPEHAAGWVDSAGAHPTASTDRKDADTVLRTIRHALAHGNVVYLDEQGREHPGNRVSRLAFLSRHEDGKSHRVAIFGEEDFLQFVKAWIEWLETFPPDHELAFPAAAE